MEDQRDAKVTSGDAEFVNQPPKKGEGCFYCDGARGVSYGLILGK